MVHGEFPVKLHHTCNNPCGFCPTPITELPPLFFCPQQEKVSFFHANVVLIKLCPTLCTVNWLQRVPSAFNGRWHAQGNCVLSTYFPAHQGVCIPFSHYYPLNTLTGFHPYDAIPVQSFFFSKHGWLITGKLLWMMKECHWLTSSFCTSLYSLAPLIFILIDALLNFLTTPSLLRFQTQASKQG